MLTVVGCGKKVRDAKMSLLEAQRFHYHLLMVFAPSHAPLNERLFFWYMEGFPRRSRSNLPELDKELLWWSLHMSIPNSEKQSLCGRVFLQTTRDNDSVDGLELLGLWEDIAVYWLGADESRESEFAKSALARSLQ